MNSKAIVLRFTAWAVVVLAGAAAAQQTQMPPRTQDRPLESRIASQERPQRDAVLKPDEVVRALQLHHGEIVADIGAGTGYFTRRFARAVAPDGKVYAVDIAADVIDYQKERAQKENLKDIVFVVSKADDPLLPKNGVDLAFFCDVVHHLENRVAYYRTLISDIKPDGQMAIIDYHPNSPHAPHPPNELVSREQAISEAEQAGFKKVKEFTFLPDYYFLVFAKK